MKSQNSQGQFAKGVQILITKKLQEIANECGVKVKALVRDELEETYKRNVYASYSPITEAGKATKQYNETHKHQKAANYHHTGIFANSVKAIIDGKTVKIIIEDKPYPDGTSTTQVYKWLTEGTTKTPKSNVYPYKDKDGEEQWAPYVPTPKHSFNQTTLADMTIYLNQLSAELKNNKGKNISPYYKKNRR